MIRVARLTSLALALLIAVTSQQMAMARGTMKDAAGHVVLCTGQGLVSVTLDHQGNPMGPVHICPDCVLAHMATVDADVSEDPLVIHIQTLGQTPEPGFDIPLVHNRASARDPPLTV